VLTGRSCPAAAAAARWAPLGVRDVTACATLGGVGVFAVLALIGPLLLLATTVVGLWTYGPLGWLASVALVAAVAWACRWSTRTALRWWRSTKAPVQVQVRPSDSRR
jgi:hypothetical protein